MRAVDVYSRYFRAEAEFAGVKRNGAAVKLTAESEGGFITYIASVSFFPHVTDDDFAVSCDAFLSAEIYRAKGRRSAKREAALEETLRGVIDGLAEGHGAAVKWDEPL